MILIEVFTGKRTFQALGEDKSDFRNVAAAVVTFLGNFPNDLWVSSIRYDFIVFMFCECFVKFEWVLILLVFYRGKWRSSVESLSNTEYKHKIDPFEVTHDFNFTTQISCLTVWCCAYRNIYASLSGSTQLIQTTTSFLNCSKLF